ncbi:MAG: Phosphoadenosine phosphosulfate [Beijerinckiaceae bacterium]|nr:MAG: Phosphoadenosine phosphosulfate [Beijerinckiaceae bacterium]
MVDVTTIAAVLLPKTPLERLKLVRDRIAGRIVFTTSFGLEDQVLTQLIFSENLDIEVATLDTGRLFPDTYTLWAETEMRYGQRIRGFVPEREHVEALLADQGINGFVLSVEARKACCGARKVEPLKRALAGAAVWITGLRAGQSANRGSMSVAEFDAGFGLLKVNPLIDWSREKAVAFASANAVPVNPLHAQGFLSIGCQPCTRALQPGEDERAGRWWWENDAAKECGLHVGADGKLVRSGVLVEART